MIAAFYIAGCSVLYMHMKGNTSMKRLSMKLAVLLAMLMALTFVVGGTASAHTVTTTHQMNPTAMTQVESPDCGYVELSNWNFSGVNIIKWNNTCNGARHCEAIDDSYYGGGFLLILDAYNANGVFEKEVSSSRDPFSPGQSFNTDGISGYASYVCSAATY
jgi:uncharacterized protein (UPF0333 family)